MAEYAPPPWNCCFDILSRVKVIYRVAPRRTEFESFPRLAVRVGVQQDSVSQSLLLFAQKYPPYKRALQTIESIVSASCNSESIQSWLNSEDIYVKPW